MQIWKYATLAMLVPGGASAAHAVHATPPRSQAARCTASEAQMLQAIRNVHDKQHNVGLAVALWADGRMVFQQGMGLADREAKLPFKPETPAMVASMTKALTGLALLKAVEAGKIDLDAPIQTYVPDFPVKPQLVLTVRRLAAHLAGQRHWGPERESILLKRHWSDVREPMAYYRNDPLIEGAGTKYQYSSNNYNLLAVALQNATGMKFEDYVRRNVIAPLHLDTAGFDDVRSKAWRKVAPRYSMTEPFGERRQLPAMTRVADFDYSFNQGGGNMSMSVVDMIKLGRAVLAPGFLTAASYATLARQPTIDGVESPMSAGWFVNDASEEPRFFITGAQPGAQAGLYVYPKRNLVVAAVANSWGDDARSGDLVMKALTDIADLCHH